MADKQMTAASLNNITTALPVHFYIKGFTDLPHIQYYYVYLCFVYAATVLCNSLLIYVIFLVKSLHTAKYLAVCHLAVTDLCESTALIPKLLDTFLADHRYIGYEACMSYMFFVLFFLSLQSLCLLTLAYDRFIAICVPLRYHMLVTKEIMSILIVVKWGYMLILLGITVGMLNPLSFCRSLVIESDFCDHKPTFILTCDDKTLNQIISSIVLATIIFLPLVIIVFTYLCISVALIRIGCAKERAKAMKTCTSHLFLVAIFFLPLLGTNVDYNDPNARILNSCLTQTLPPLLNPIIYSLQTEEVWNSIKKLYRTQRVNKITLSR